MYYVPVHVSSIIVLIFSRTIVLVKNLVSSLSLGDYTKCCTNTIVLLKMSIIVLETCTGM